MRYTFVCTGLLLEIAAIIGHPRQQDFYSMVLWNIYFDYLFAVEGNGRKR